MTDLIERSIGTQIELQIALPDRLPLAFVDANQIELAVLNLVLNARDAMPDGGVLRIEANEAESTASKAIDARRYVRLIVSDTGQGMNADTLRKATDPFFSTKGIGKGTGLGLSMIQGLAVQLNGELRLESEPGRGTRAELWLPVTEQAPQEHAPESVGSPRAPAKTITVLVVDDDALIAMSTVHMLEDLGFTAIEANSGSSRLRDCPNGAN